jgi:hypothetical protein
LRHDGPRPEPSSFRQKDKKVGLADGNLICRYKGKIHKEMRNHLPQDNKISFGTFKSQHNS